MLYLYPDIIFRIKEKSGEKSKKFPPNILNSYAHFIKSHQLYSLAHFKLPIHNSQIILLKSSDLKVEFYLLIIAFINALKFLKFINNCC